MYMYIYISLSLYIYIYIYTHMYIYIYIIRRSYQYKICPDSRLRYPEALGKRPYTFILCYAAFYYSTVYYIILY